VSDNEVDCARFRALLGRYFDEAFAERSALDAHAASCADCRHAFARMTGDLADLPCRTFVELITEYLEQSMTPGDRARMDRHLELCEGCRAYLRQMRVTIELSGATRTEPPDPHLRDMLVAAFRASHGERQADEGAPVGNQIRTLDVLSANDSGPQTASNAIRFVRPRRRRRLPRPSTNS
jgi:predicted anti-sigma-YlaC factor YlaD